MASDSKTIDVAGHKISKTEAVFFGVAAVGVVVLAVMEKRKSAAAAASAAGSTTTGQFTDPAGNVCAAPDPSTGYCPGTPEDTSAQEQLSSGSSDYGLAEDTTGTVASDGGILNYGSSVPVFTDNGSWGQYVEQQLGSDGSDAIAAAIAKYLSGQSLTTAQVTIVEEAVAIANYPPVSGAGGYPPSMNVSGGSSGSGTTSNITVPNVTGQTYANASTALTAAGLSASKAAGAWADPVTAEAPAAGTMAAEGATVTLTGTAVNPGSPAAPVTVPDVTGEKDAAAIAKLTAAGFKVSVLDQYSATPAHIEPGHSGTVTSQNPPGGKKAPKGSTVNIHEKIS